MNTVFPLELVRAALRVTLRDHQSGNCGPAVGVIYSPKYRKPMLHLTTGPQSHGGRCTLTLAQGGVRG